MSYPFRIWAEVDHGALARNISRIQARAGVGQGSILVVKADAYGHGAVAVAKTAAFCGVDMLGVGDSTEALEIAANGVDLPLLILGTVIDEEVADVTRHAIQIGVHSSSRLDLLSREALRSRRRLKVHLNIDTGMGRLGVPPPQAERVAQAILEAPGLDLAGIYTHFAHQSTTACPTSLRQDATFRSVLAALRAKGLLPRAAKVHAASSASLYAGIGLGLDAVRPGLAAYGYLPTPHPDAAELEPVLSLRTQIIFYKDVAAGTPIGYEGTWRAPTATRIATVPAGYNDGIPWRLGLEGKGEALLRGRRVPFAGRVTMDYLCLDIGSVPGATIGDQVTLIGRDGSEAINALELAASAGSTPYEILCHMGKRVRRVAASSCLQGMAQ